MDRTSGADGTPAQRCPFCGGQFHLEAADASLTTCPGCQAGVVLAVVTRPAGGNAAGSPPAVRAPFYLPVALLDRYQPVRELGHGSFGTVFLARDRLLQRDVALKILGRVEMPAARERFLREAQSLARVAHPGIVRVFDAFEADGYPCLITEHIQGGTLSGLIRSSGPLPWRQGVAIAVGILEALRACHSLGIIHRDLKPENVLVDGAGQARIADFGLAKAAADAPASATLPGMLVGTPLYMAPEQLRGEPATPASDLYAVGALLFEMLTGRPPHPSGNLLKLVEMKSCGPWTEPAELPPVPRDVLAGLRSALAPVPGARPPSAGHLATLLAASLDRPEERAPVVQPTRDLSALTDEQLLQGAQDGEGAAFAEVIRRHQQRAWRIAYVFLGDRAEAEDIAQTAFLKILTSLPRWTPRARFTTYLHCVVARLCRDRVQKSSPTLDEELEEIPAASSSISGKVARKERSAAVREALDSLPPNQRMAVVLRYFERLGARESAEAMGVTPKAVERLLASARQRLLEVLGPAL